MSKEDFKWKCDICGVGFNNFHAQGFDNKIYCPLCYYKHEFNQLQQENQKYKEVIDKVRDHIKSKITKSFEYDYGIDMSNSSDRLFTETIIELELIYEILKEVE